MIPILLQPNSLYFIDLEMFNESSFWRTSFKFLKEQRAGNSITIIDIVDHCSRNNTPISTFREMIILFLTNMHSLHNICLLESEKNGLRQLFELVLGANQVVLDTIDKIPTMDAFLLENSDMILSMYWNSTSECGATGQVYVCKDHKFVFSEKHLCFERKDLHSITLFDDGKRLQLTKNSITGLYTLHDEVERKYYVLTEVPCPTPGRKSNKWVGSMG